MTPEKLPMKEYGEWLANLKERIKESQVKAVLSVNKELILLYWDLGRELHRKQTESGWGNAVVDTLAADLRRDFPELKGFSRRNLFYMKEFYQFYQSDFEIVQQLVAQIPWGHNLKIIGKSA